MVSTRFQRGLSAVFVVATALTGVSCGDVVRSSRAPVLLIVQNVEAASGADPTEFFAFLLSDVQTLITIEGQPNPVPTFFNDPGRATFRITLKNPGPPTAPLSPSELNSVTLTRYRVVFRRADGRNTPGVDVPHSFDGALTGTVAPGAASTVAFNIVRWQHKLEPPLRNMVGLGGSLFLSTIAEITFYGQDQVGNEISVQAFMDVNFGDFADPD